MNILARSRTSQPQFPVSIDYSNPLTKGLVAVGHPFGAFSTRPTAKFTTKHGIAVRGGVLAQRSVTNGVANSTVLVVDTYPGADDGNWWCSSSTIYADCTAGWPNDLGIRVHSAKLYGKLNIAARDTGGYMQTASIDVSPAGNITVGGSLVIVGTVDQTLLVTGYGNGVKIGTSSSLQGFSYNAPAPGNGVLFGNAGDNIADSVSAQALALRWARVLLPAEIAKISANPWQIFKRRKISFGVGVTVQIARPISDISNTGWVPSSGTDLYPMIGETVRNDATFIAATAVGALCECGLESIGDPNVSTGHLPTLMLSAPGGGGITVRLRQGTTTIATWTYHPGATPTEYTPALSGAEADSITDYTALRLQFEAIA